jgi:WD40 repeat protein
LNTGAELHRFPTSPLVDGLLIYNLLSLSYSPDGRSALAGVGDGTMILYDLQTYEEIRRYGEEQQQTALFDVEFSPDGKLIASASGDSSLLLWDAETGALLHRMVGHNSEVRGIAFSPDGKLLVSVSLDRAIIIWDVATGEPIRRFLWEESNGMFSVAFSPDGQYILAGGVGQTSLWRVDATLDELITWTSSNRYVPQPTCIQRELYRLQPECVNGVDATLIP